MADVRSMLRSELASRKESANTAATTTATAAASKKRKHVSEDTPDRKRARNENPEPPPNTEDNLVDDQIDETALTLTEAAEDSGPAPNTEPIDDAVDEDEWARFEREMAGIESESATTNPMAALTAQPALESAPLSAEELAKQAREEMSAQKGAKDVEGEEEKEDVARRMEDEFEEMEALEDRVKKLRERREALRRGSTDDPTDPGGVVEEEYGGDVQTNPAQNESDESDVDSEEDEWANWGRR